ncbi:hypothetical protein NUSPORA_02183 [Nucleospora cyclopteri]
MGEEITNNEIVKKKKPKVEKIPEEKESFLIFILLLIPRIIYCFFHFVLLFFKTVGSFFFIENKPIYVKLKFTDKCKKNLINGLKYVRSQTETSPDLFQDEFLPEKTSKITYKFYKTNITNFNEVDFYKLCATIKNIIKEELNGIFNYNTCFKMKKILKKLENKQNQSLCLGEMKIINRAIKNEFKEMDSFKKEVYDLLYNILTISIENSYITGMNKEAFCNNFEYVLLPKQFFTDASAVKYGPKIIEYFFMNAN